MKLKELAIDGYAETPTHLSNQIGPTQVRHNLRLGLFNSGLNFVYGENGTEKTSLRQRVRESLLGISSTQTSYSVNESFSQSSSPLIGTCTLTFSDGVNQYQTNGTSLSNGQQLKVTHGLDAELFEAVLSVGFADPVNSISRLANVLRTRFAVPAGAQAAGDQSLYLQHQHQQETRRKESEKTRLELAELQSERNRLQSEIDAERIQHQSRVADLDRQIALVQHRLAELNAHQIQAEIGNVQQEISGLQSKIQNAGVTYVQTVAAPQPVAPVPVQQSVDHTQLYRRLDEVELQIGRWRDLQTDVQKQRVRLKDEMLAWKELTIDSVDHPYHNARRILVEIERKVDQSEAQATPWLESHGPEDSQQAVNFVADACEETRANLNQLCHELSEPYTQIRHKYAALELKHLREIYTEMDDNIRDLLARRESILREISQVDGKGAEAIVRADDAFIKFARQEGYHAARVRFIGELTTTVTTAPAIAPQPTQPTYQTIPVDTTTERQALLALESRLQSLQANYHGSLAQQEPLRQQLSEFNRQRELIGVTVLETQHRSRLVQLDLDIQSKQAELNSILLLIEQNKHFVVTPPSPLLVAAASHLVKLTAGELTKVWLSSDNHVNQFSSGSLATAAEIQVRDQHGKVFNFSAINRDQQQLTLLALVLAAKETVRNQGVESPLWLDDLFLTLDTPRINPTLELLADFCRDDLHQVVILTQHRFLADRLPGFTSLELVPRPTTAPFTPAAYPLPETDRTPIVPQRTTSQERPTPVVIKPGELAKATVATSVPVQEPRVMQTSDVTSRNDLAEPITAYPQHSSHRRYPLSKYKPSDGRSEFNNVDEDTADTRSYFTSNLAQANFTQASFTQPSRVTKKFRRSSERANPRVASVSVSEFGDRLQQVSSTSESTSIESVRMFDSAQVRFLHDSNIRTAGDFLDLSVADLDADFEVVGLVSDFVTKTQDAIWLLCWVPNLQPVEARVLVACGIIEPEHLATSNSRNLFERVSRFLRSSEGRPYLNSERELTSGLVEQWQQGLLATRSSRRQRMERGDHKRTYSDRSNDGDRNASRASRSNQSSRSAAPRLLTYPYNDRNSESNSRSHGRSSSRRSGSQSNQHQDPRVQNDRDETRDSRESRERNGSRSERQERAYSARPPRMDFTQRDDRAPRKPRVAPAPVAPASTRQSFVQKPRNFDKPKTPVKPKAERQSGAKSSTGNLKFYLDLKDHIEAAPSIGTKTAERFEKIGVHTIAEFLKQTAESLAEKLDYKRMSAKVVRQWQHQARLVCRVPNLRGHDAQLLVACEIIDAEELSTMQPKTLFGIIGPFAETKEGMKIIRNGKKPDLQEITDWIAFAQHTRSIQAA